ncbi:MAG: hypothetical protein IPJ03_15690 [Ignavibacteriales bacterium]|nr:hypothetical protein [Ignavibacteriales bacterium]
MARLKTLAKCRIEDCPNTIIIGFGYCNKHYLKFKRWGDPLYIHRIIHTEKYCTIGGCTNKARCMGLCNKHYRQINYEKRMLKKGRTRPPDNGRSKLPEFCVWLKMRERCLKPNTKEYGNYGGRGIKVCDRWVNNFNNFLEDMGSRPTPKHQIDRIDNEGNYEPNNCRWVSQTVNARNKRTTLTEHQVRDIRKHLFMGLMNIDIEPMVGVSRDIICNIRRGHGYNNYGLLTTTDQVVIPTGY